MQGGIPQVGSQQALMASLCNNAASLKHDDPIHPMQINKAMGDHEKCKFSGNQVTSVGATGVTVSGLM
jgi:hypothetical protein